MSKTPKFTKGPWSVSAESVDPEWAIVTGAGGKIVANALDNMTGAPAGTAAPGWETLAFILLVALIAASALASTISLVIE